MACVLQRRGFEPGSLSSGRSHLGILFRQVKVAASFLIGQRYEDIGGRWEAIYPASTIRQVEEFGEDWCTLESLSRSEDSEF